MHIINIEQALIEGTRVSHFNKSQPKGWSVRFVLISILAHAVVIFVIFNNLHISKPLPLPSAKEPAKIKSYLYTPLPQVIKPPIVDLVIEKTVLGDTSQKVEIALPVPEEKITPPQANVEPKAQIDEQISNTVSEEANDIQAPTIEVLEANTPDLETKDMNTQTQNSLTTSKLHTDISKYGLRGTVQQQLRNVEMKRFSEMARTASQEFSTSMTSPTIDAPVYTEEYQYLKEPGVSEIECDGSIKSNLTIMSSIMGGKVKCRDKNFQMYINKHLNKDVENK